MIDDKAHHKLTDEVPGRPIVRSRFAADRLARRPVAKAALEFASPRHANQYRSIDHAPFIAHPIEVGWLLTATASQTK